MPIHSKDEMLSLAQALGIVNDSANSIRKGNEFHQNQDFEMQKMRAGKDLEQQMQNENLKRAQGLVDDYAGKGKKVNVSLTGGGGVTLGQSEQDDMGKLLQMLGLKATIDERNDKKVERLQDDVTKSGAPQAVQSLKRAEKSIPGITTGHAKFKSVGGMSNLVPNWLVPALEGKKVLGHELMPQGASDERAALQDMINTKIYDSSGKQINESEVSRLKQGMGLSGMFNPNTINDATKQISNTVLEKNRGISAGYPQDTVNTFKQRGGIAGSQSMPELLGTGASSREIRVKHRQSGQTGTVPENEFDPSIYDRIQ